MTDVETLTFDGIDNGQAFGDEDDHIVREDVNPLQQVFNACDHNGDGYVKIADLVALAQKYAQQSGNGEVSPATFFDGFTYFFYRFYCFE